ncbi:phage portal protein, partial [Klebsiella pneumoniae]|uniref:phage portal protein n=1 Tax=Klebsiella pneumoniae TaxID=573 RepID=UPI003AF8C4EF
MSQHDFNRKQISYLYDYVRGKQPVLDRVKKIRPEIKNTIVENHALEIKNFKNG